MRRHRDQYTCNSSCQHCSCLAHKLPSWWICKSPCQMTSQYRDRTWGSSCRQWHTQAHWRCGSSYRRRRRHPCSSCHRRRRRRSCASCPVQGNEGDDVSEYTSWHLPEHEWNKGSQSKQLTSSSSLFFLSSSSFLRFLSSSSFLFFLLSSSFLRFLLSSSFLFLLLLSDPPFLSSLSLFRLF